MVLLSMKDNEDTWARQRKYGRSSEQCLLRAVGQRSCEGSQSLAQNIANALSRLTRVYADKYHTKFTSRTPLTSLDTLLATHFIRSSTLHVNGCSSRATWGWLVTFTSAASECTAAYARKQRRLMARL